MVLSIIQDDYLLILRIVKSLGNLKNIYNVAVADEAICLRIEALHKEYFQCHSSEFLINEKCVIALDSPRQQLKYRYWRWLCSVRTSCHEPGSNHTALFCHSQASLSRIVRRLLASEWRKRVRCLSPKICLTKMWCHKANCTKVFWEL